MAIDEFLLAALVCPENHTTLTVADSALVKKVNDGIKNGTVRSRSGEVITDVVHGLLVREDDAYAYAIRSDVPNMLVDASIALEQVR